jgi:hypothetical protein
LLSFAFLKQFVTINEMGIIEVHGEDHWTKEAERLSAYDVEGHLAIGEAILNAPPAEGPETLEQFQKSMKRFGAFCTERSRLLEYGEGRRAA